MLIDVFKQVEEVVEAVINYLTKDKRNQYYRINTNRDAMIRQTFQSSFPYFQLLVFSLIKLTYYYFLSCISISGKIQNVTELVLDICFKWHHQLCRDVVLLVSCDQDQKILLVPWSSLASLVIHLCSNVNALTEYETRFCHYSMEYQLFMECRVLLKLGIAVHR